MQTEINGNENRGKWRKNKLVCVFLNVQLLSKKTFHELVCVFLSVQLLTNKTPFMTRFAKNWGAWLAQESI